MVIQVDQSRRCIQKSGTNGYLVQRESSATVSAFSKAFCSREIFVGMRGILFKLHVSRFKIVAVAEFQFLGKITVIHALKQGLHSITDILIFI